MVGSLWVKITDRCVWVSDTHFKMGSGFRYTGVLSRRGRCTEWCCTWASAQDELCRVGCVLRQPPCTEVVYIGQCAR